MSGLTTTRKDAMTPELRAMFERSMITPGLTFDGCMAEFARLVAEDCEKIVCRSSNSDRDSGTLINASLAISRKYGLSGD